MLAVSKVLIAPIFTNRRNFKEEKGTLEKEGLNRWILKRCINLIIAFLPFLFPFQLQRFKNVGAINTFEAASTSVSYHTLFQIDVREMSSFAFNIPQVNYILLGKRDLSRKNVKWMS